MATLSTILDQVLAKALPTLEPYAERYAGEWDSDVWSELEDEIGMVYGSYLRSVLPDPHVVRGDHDLPYVVAIAETPPYGKNVTLGAINQRGLFRQNGRATLLEPCGAFLPRTTAGVPHDALHHVYMHLVKKAESINQLFLGTTNLGSLAVMFAGEGAPQIEVSPDRLHGVIHVSTALADKLATPELRRRWKETIVHVLTRLEGEAILDTIRRTGRLPTELAWLIEPDYQPGRVDALDVIREWPALFSQWLRIYQKPDVANIEKAGILFSSWLWSVAWLMFYCQEAVAGAFFYTVRLPRIIDQPHHVLPETSLSLVSKEPLTEGQLTELRATSAAFSESESFRKLRAVAEKSIARFCSKRLGKVEVQPPPDKTHADLRSVLQGQYADPHDLPVDFRRLYFLISLARSLVGRRHEGQSLRFCLIHGFGFERVDAESNGALQEFRADLLHRWLRFLESAQLIGEAGGRGPETRELGEALANWIKSNDLQLQRPDVAVYLEESAAFDYPLPVGLVQVRYLSKEELHPVGTELELRQALRDLTARSHRTVAIVTSVSGLFVFMLGRCLLVRCSGRENWGESFHLHITGDHKPLEDQIETDLVRVFSQTFADRPTVAERAAKAMRHLCEALVSMGHGAMFVVRSKTDAACSPSLPPLNPVWLLRSSLHGDDVRHECAIYALMAALDGATELLLPDEGPEPIGFRCRRFAQTLPDHWVWADDQEEPGHAVLRDQVDVRMTSTLVGKGTRHHTALVLSRGLERALVITVSADGPVTIYKTGSELKLPSGIAMRFAP